jgi:hypothetical protein
MARDDDFADLGNSPVDGWPPDFDRLVIPDDASELDPEARALARERRAASRLSRLRGALAVRHWRRYALSWPIAVAVLAVAGTVVSLMVMFRPATHDAPRARPLASGGLRPPGEENGLVPDVEVSREGGSPSPLRAFRPGVLVLVPAGCACADLLHSVVRVADKHHVYAIAIGADLPAIPADLARGSLIRAADPDHHLLPVYAVAGTPVLLLVHDDGVVSRILRTAVPDNVLDTEVVALAA